MANRYFSLLSPDPHAPPVRHFIGVPPELGGVASHPVPFPRPDVLTLTPDPEGGVMFDRYTASGATAGDTWHETVEYAMEQAALEYGEAAADWREVPDDVTDVVAYALAHLR